MIFSSRIKGGIMIEAPESTPGLRFSTPKAVESMEYPVY